MYMRSPACAQHQLPKTRADLEEKGCAVVGGGLFVESSAGAPLFALCCLDDVWCVCVCLCFSVCVCACVVCVCLHTYKKYVYEKKSQLQYICFPRKSKKSY